MRRIKEFLAYLYCYGNPLGLVIVWRDLYLPAIQEEQGRGGC